MTVYPGSLDYLYHNGVLECIPYEAYSMPIAQQPSMNVNPYSNLKQQNQMQMDSYQGIGSDAFITRDVKSNKTSAITKGLIGCGILLGTLALILKGKPKKV